MTALGLIVQRPTTWGTVALALGTLAAGSDLGTEWLQNLFGVIVPALAFPVACLGLYVAGSDKGPSREACAIAAMEFALMMVVCAAVGWYWTAAAWLVGAIGFWAEWNHKR